MKRDRAPAKAISMNGLTLGRSRRSNPGTTAQKLNRLKGEKYMCQNFLKQSTSFIFIGICLNV